MAAEKVEIYKFPRTRHIYNTGGGATKDDLVRAAFTILQFCVFADLSKSRNNANPNSGGMSCSF